MSYRMLTNVNCNAGFSRRPSGDWVRRAAIPPTSPPTTQPPAPPAPPPTPTPPTVSVVEVSPNAAALEVGKTQRFTATAKASDGNVISGVNFTWSSSNTAVVTINSGGMATA